MAATQFASGISRPAPAVLDAASLKGFRVVNSLGDDLGNIEAIVLDVSTGRVAYAVLSFGGVLGMGDKLFAMPWRALQLDAARERFVLDVSRERLEAAPGFDKSRWPKMADREWALELHAYYDAEPYWDDPLSASSG
ncbi:MAG TPA: PRC-barrel domain-containing protein [Casimicrobiaceae bacterium]|nr:PRC-barrel domain-containing protein [Casimicrobiaceae bacterium]